MSSSRRTYTAEFKLGAVVLERQARRDSLVSEIQRQAAKSTIEAPSIEAKIVAALGEFDELPSLANDLSNLPAIGELFRRADVQLLLRFKPVKPKKRVVNQLCDGIIPIGNVPAPIEK